MLHGTAAQHADFDCIVEQHEIDRGLQCRRSTVVLGVKEFQVGQGDVADLGLALDLGFAEIDKSGLAELGDPLERLAPGLEHRVNEMHAAPLVGENLPDEQALIQLAAFLGALLLKRPLGVDRLARWQQGWIAA